MKKITTIALIFLICQYLTACGGDAKAGSSNEEESNSVVEVENQSEEENILVGEVENLSLAHEVIFFGQDDILHQRTDVITSEDELTELLEDMPSLDRDMIEFDPNTQLLISIISVLQGCTSYPTVIDVVETESTIEVRLINIREVSPETCNPSLSPIYRANFVAFDKVDKPISVIIDADVS